MLELETGTEHITFRLNWDVNVKNRVIDPKISLEMLMKLALPHDAAFTSLFDYSNLEECFAGALMQVRYTLFYIKSLLYHLSFFL